MSKVKVVGYAKKEFFGNGVEYRNFSPDLVGNQLTSNDGTPSFTFGNFNISTNLDDRVSKRFITNRYSKFISLETLNVDEAFEDVVTKYSKNVKLNLDYDDVLSYAFFGSFKEFVRVSLENIIIKWPASLYVSETDPTNPSNVGNTVTTYNYDSVSDKANITIDVSRIENPFSVNFLSGGTIENTFNETNKLRNLQTNFSHYVISNQYGDFKVNSFIGASGLTNSEITLEVEGDPFPNYGLEIINYHIKPNKTKIEEFFYNLNDFENKLLNRLSTPIYTSSFKVKTESEFGTTVETIKKITWPLRDGYNIDFNSTEYSRYVNKLLEISELSDSSRSNLMVRFLVSSSISEFDSVPDIDGSYPDTNGQKMTSALKIYGREFDEVKKYSDGVKFANVVTYDKKNNTPDIAIKNLARVLGWQLTSSITDIDVLGDFLSLNNNYYDGYSRGLSDAEVEVELWRRIIMNTPWLWKSKGTRKAIEFLFRFIGVPKGLITFNEYLYVAEDKVNVETVEEIMEFFNNTRDISGLNLDSDGYPRVLPNTPEMYFQKAGLWYRQTGGANPDIDILEGNNPHIGPYDRGQQYINQFTECLVPNFEAGNEEDPIEVEDVELFTNYKKGTFDECCDENVFVVVPLNQNFNTILETNQNKYLNNFPVSEAGCTGTTNTWTLEAQLRGETFFESVIDTTTDDNVITNTQYANKIYELSGQTELSGVTFETNNDEIRILAPDGCDSELLDDFFKIVLYVSTDYDCENESVIPPESTLTAFNVSNIDNPIDACETLSSPLSPDTLYHDGDGPRPALGDTVYIDEFGVNIYVSPDSSNDNRDLYMGPSINNTNNFLRTDSNGKRRLLLCEGLGVEECVVLGRTSTSDTPGSFYIDGVTGARTATIKYSISDIVTGSDFGILKVATSDSRVFLSERRTEAIVEVNITPSDNEFDFIDEVLFASSYDGIRFSIFFEVLEIDGGECIDGPTRLSKFLKNGVL